jgi:hypothetical protein
MKVFAVACLLITSFCSVDGMEKSALEMISPESRKLLHTLCFSYQHQEAWPKNLVEDFPDVRCINAASNSISMVGSLPKCLECLYLSSNNLTSLGIVSETLKELDVSNNKIESIEGFHCPCLERLYLDRNPLRCFRNMPEQPKLLLLYLAGIKVSPEDILIITQRCHNAQIIYDSSGR